VTIRFPRGAGACARPVAANAKNVSSIVRAT